MIPILEPLRSSEDELLRKVGEDALTKLEKRRSLGIPSYLRRLDQPVRQ